MKIFRYFLLTIVLILLVSCAATSEKKTSETNEYKYLAKYVSKHKVWNTDDWDFFIHMLNAKHLCELALEMEVMNEQTVGINSSWDSNNMKLLKVVDPVKAINSFGTKEALINEMQDAVKKSTYYLPIVHSRVDWDETVQKTYSRTMGVDLPSGQATYFSERQLLEGFFSKQWEKLSREQRQFVLDHSDLSQLKENQKLMLLTHSGSQAFNLVRQTVLMNGFQFYTTMSSVIAASGKVLGVTFPFAVYSGASRVAGAISGPWGWGIIAASSAGQALYFLKPDERKAIRVILAVHVIKTKALM